MGYVKTTWVNGGTPAINQSNLNKIEQGIVDAETTALRNSGRYQSNYGFGDATLSSAITYSDIGRLTEGDLSGAAYDSKSFSVGTQEMGPQGVSCSTDGTIMYIIGTSGATVYQYALSTPWDVSTASYASKSLVVSSQDAAPYSVRLSSDGTKLYVMGAANDTVYQYALGTAWDVSTASYASKSFSVGTQEAATQGLDFSTDGTKMYIVGSINDTVYQYALGTAWDVSTASYASKSFRFQTTERTSKAVMFTNNGYMLYAIGTDNDYVYEAVLTTAWDVSTATYINYYSVTSQDTDPSDIYIKPDATKFYVVGNASNTVYQYSMTAIATAGTITKTITPADVDNWGTLRCYAANDGANNSATITIKDVSDNVLIAATPVINGWNSIDLSAISASTYNATKFVYTFARNAYTDSSVAISNLSVSYEGKLAKTWETISETVVAADASAVSISVPTKTYRKFKVFVDNLLTDTGANKYLSLYFNSDTGNNYSYYNDYPLSAINFSSIYLTPNLVDTLYTFSVILEINNTPTIAKTVTYSYMRATKSAVVYATTGGGTYDPDKHVEIATIDFKLNSDNIQRGARFIVWGMR